MINLLATSSDLACPTRHKFATLFATLPKHLGCLWQSCKQRCKLMSCSTSLREEVWTTVLFKSGRANERFNSCAREPRARSPASGSADQSETGNKLSGSSQPIRSHRKTGKTGSGNRLCMRVATRVGTPVATRTFECSSLNVLLKVFT